MNLRDNMRKFIAKLYNKYCRARVGTLFLGGLQRDFEKTLNVKEEKERNLSCKTFVESKVCEWVFNELLKEYSEALFSMGETEDARNILHNNINVLLQAEQKIRGYANWEEECKEFDEYQPL